MNRIYLGNVPEQDYVRDRGMEGLPRERIRPCPASLEILTKLSMYMVPAYPCSRGRRSPMGPEREVQIARKATTIQAKMPTPTIVRVVVSIATALPKRVAEIADRLAGALRGGSIFHVPSA
ncbi:hypothetical protein P9272_02330 [Mesorhizobium sp. WSM4976]|uniref:hypothetical protein n=1 Tax=Mesorhizobium sp. WSM4976 TaxID=3038549 RepID=UPI002415DF9F|nr:hypothetical protein [Mesorhizobium sp. WSM4976]MDG4892434.1 hypothetical protein [Mesorhizobium sp. WSM4976]